VRVDVDHPDHVYRADDLLQVRVTSERAGYLYLLYRQANGKVACLFPNKYQPDNRIEPHQTTVVPADTADFNLRITPPFGDEVLIALVSREPLKAGDFGAKSLTDSEATPVDVDSILKAVSVELRPRPQGWAEHHVLIKTFPTASLSDHSTPGKRRLAMFVGISKYKDQRVRQLRVSDRDATVLAAAMQKYGKLDGACLLTNEHATLSRIRSAFEQLVRESRPGDEVFIYWSGHGGKCADTDGDEEDGQDEFLVPYDAGGETVQARLASVLLDDTFGRWMQDLDGRKVVVILDACYAGGQSAMAKGINDKDLFPGLLGTNGQDQPFGFLDSELIRTKDIGQGDAAMLCSSGSDEMSVEGDKLSVMTGFLLQRVMQVERLTLEDAYRYVKVEVPKFLKDHGADRTQTPMLINHIGRVYVRP